MARVEAELIKLRRATTLNKLAWIVLGLVVGAVIVVSFLGWREARDNDYASYRDRLEGCERINALRVEFVRGDREDDEEDDRVFTLALAEVSGAPPERVEAFLTVLERIREENQQDDPLATALRQVDCSEEITPP
jgi:hypothetical protein